MNGTFNTKQTYGYGRVDIEGSAVLAAGPTISRVEGAGFAVARAGAGDYTITPTNPDGSAAKYEALVAVSLSISRDSAAFVDDDVLEYFWDSTNQVLHVLNIDRSGGALDDLAAGSGFSFKATFRNSSVTP